MFLKNLGKAVLVMVIIYILAFMAVVWAPWDPSLNFTTVLDDWKRDQVIGFWVYQALAFISFMIIWSGQPFSDGLTGLLEVSSAIALIFIPIGIRWMRYGEENLLSLPFGVVHVVQVVATTALLCLAFTMRNRQQPTPA